LREQLAQHLRFS